jgi:regulator of RNase E activity RraA
MSDSPKSIEALRALLLKAAVPTVVSLLWRKGFRNTFMFGPKPLNPNAVKFAGPAFTVRTIPVREDLVEAQNAGGRPNLQAKSVADIAAGQVLAVAMDGETRTAFMGDIMTTHLMVKGCAGIVLDGGVSDAAAISTMSGVLSTGIHAAIVIARALPPTRLKRVRLFMLCPLLKTVKERAGCPHALSRQ